MFDSTEKILHAANVLEKVAQYLEAEEEENHAKQAAEIERDFITPLKERGETLPEGLAEKLAKADPEIRGLLKELAEKKADYSEKVASLGGPDDDSVEADDDPILAFVSGE